MRPVGAVVFGLWGTPVIGNDPRATPRVLLGVLQQGHAIGYLLAAATYLADQQLHRLGRGLFAFSIVPTFISIAPGPFSRYAAIA